MKYSINEYEKSADYMEKMKYRRELFRKVTKTRSTINLTMVTTFGVKRGKYSPGIQNEIVMDDLFRDLI